MIETKGSWMMSNACWRERAVRAFQSYRSHDQERLCEAEEGMSLKCSWCVVSQVKVSGTTGMINSGITNQSSNFSNTAANRYQMWGMRLNPRGEEQYKMTSDRNQGDPETCCVCCPISITVRTEFTGSLNLFLDN